MPVFRVQTPTGQVVKIEAATQEAALRGAADWSSSKASADAKRRVANTPDLVRAFTKGATLSGADEIDAFGAKLETGVSNTAKRLFGKTPEYTAQQAYDAVLQANREADEAFQGEHPVQAAGSTILGGLMMPGGGSIAKGVMGSGKGVLGATNLLGRTVRGAAAGGLLGTVEGFLGGEPGKRTEGAKSGAAVGAALGGALPVAGSAVSKAAGGAKRIANKALGGKLTNPNIEAGRRLAQALKADGLDEAQIRQVQNEWLRTGVTPQLMNVVGENTRRLFRAAGASGGAANQAAVKNVDQLAAALPDAAQSRTRSLIPDQRSVPDVEAGIAGRISGAAQPPQVRMGRAGAQISGRLNSDFEAAQRRVDQAYDAARSAAPEAAYFPSDQRPNVNAALRESVRDYDPLTVPAVTRELGRLDNLQTMSARDLFEARQRLSTLRVDGGVEARAAGNAIRAIDQQIDEAVANGALSGDPEAVRLWRQAIEARRQMGREFQSGDLVEDLTRRAPYGGDIRAPVVSQDDASAAILGRGSGISNRLDLTRDLIRLRDRLGPESQDWTDLQREAAARVMGPEAGSEAFGDAWMRLERDNPELAALLMSGQDRAGLNTSRQAISEAVGDRSALQAGQRVLNAAPDRFAADIGDATRQPVAQLGAVRALEDAIGRPTAGATGTLNRIANAPNPGENLTSLFGEDEAGNYRQAIGNLVQQLNDARFVSPNSGSQTALRLEDSGLIDKLPPTSLPGLALRALDKLSKGLTMTEQERAALMELGKSTDLEGALRAIPQQRAPISQYGVVPAIAGSNQ